MALKVVTFACNHSRLGGDNMSMLGVIEGLRAHGVIATVVLPEKGDIEVKLRNLMVKYVIIDHRVHASTRKISILFTQLKFIYYLYVFRSDILHSNDVFCNRFVARVGKILKIPTVCHVRFMVNEDQLTYYFNPQPSHIVFNSKFMKNEFIKSCPKYKISDVSSVVYNPILASNYYKPQFRQEVRDQWIAGSRFVVSIVGNISKNKGHFEFVEIAKKLLEFNKDFLFVVIGQDISEDQNQLEAFLGLVDKYNLGGNFVLHGVATDMGKLFAGVDLLLFPSHFESFGRVVVESLLASVPVVASRVGGLIEILEGNPAARLVDIGNVDAFVEAVLEVRGLAKGKEGVAASSGKEIIEKSFSFEKSVSDLMRIYKKLKE